MRFRILWLPLALVAPMIAIGGCGSSHGTAAVAAAISSVTVTCTPATVAPGGSSQCSATVQGTGTYSSTVAWSTSAGTVSSGGALTAPSTAGTVTVTATSTQDATKSGAATVNVQAQSGGGSGGAGGSGAVSSKHVVLVMEENQSYSTVVGNTADWPNLNNLIAHGALPTNDYADTHPSIGNYFMLTAGQILTNDDTSTTVWNVDNVARRMLAAGVTFRVYAEGITQGYVGGDTGLYVVRHNPFALLSDVGGNSSVANTVIWPFSKFAADVAGGHLPEFSFIVPNLDDDAHDGTPQQADAWLQSNVVGPLQNDTAFQQGGDGVLIVGFDEAATTDTTHGGGQVSPVLWGPIVKPGYRQTSATLYQHESMLRTIMELLQLSTPPGAAASAPDMMEFFGQ
jgi:phosphatidylinositol-3-phosphatase